MTPDDVRRAAEVLSEIAERFDGYTLSATARREMRSSSDDLHWLLRQADFRSTLKPADSDYAHHEGDRHQHLLQGQVLTHTHAGGDIPHGYFGHPEDPT